MCILPSVQTCQEEKAAYHHFPRPWHTVGTDVCEQGVKNCPVVVDLYSRDIEIIHLYITSSNCVKSPPLRGCL